jgi:UDP-GlcNAc:undecaprenyl-phosphate GlcNAc-1-phosphate transferase
MLLSLLVWGAEIGSFAAAPFQALWKGGLAEAFRNYSSSGTFWALLSGSFVVTACLTPLAMVVARRIGAVDRGGHRKVSQKTMPLLGGIAVALPFLIVCGLGILGASDLLSTIIGMRAQLWAVLIGGLCILGVGIIDDTRGMRARHKFFSEAAVALFLCFCGFSIQSVNLPFLGTIHFGVVLGAIITILWIVGLTNAMNIIDGLDGLASGIALIAALGLGFIAAINGAVFVVLLCTALAGSLAAFLLFNFHPARIFLGDTGSLFLGFTLAAISLTASMKMSGTVIFLAPMLALGLPLFEVTLSMLRRYIQGLPIYCADAGHIHHRLLKRGFTQRRVALILYAAGIMCLLAALFASTASTRTSALLFPLGLYAAAMLTIGWLAGYSRNLGESLEIRRRNVFYQAFVNFATTGLSSDVGVLGVNSILEITRKEMRLAYLSASFLDPAQSIGVSGTIGHGDKGSSSGPVKELRVKSACGQHILIRYQHDGDPKKRIRDEVETHLGRIFEQSTINRSTLRMDAEPIRLEEHDAPPAREHDAPPARDASRRPVWQPVSTLLETPVGAENSPN